MNPQPGKSIKAMLHASLKALVGALGFKRVKLQDTK